MRIVTTDETFFTSENIPSIELPFEIHKRVNVSIFSEEKNGNAISSINLCLHHKLEIPKWTETIYLFYLLCSFVYRKLQNTILSLGEIAQNYLYIDCVAIAYEMYSYQTIEGNNEQIKQPRLSVNKNNKKKW